jgi:N6-L-threonylcarbamoyladenine synthase
MILAFETSCDETAVAVVDDTGIRSNEWLSQIRHHRKYGGVVPELASRLHAEYIDDVLGRALVSAGVSLNDITHVAVTVGPGLEGALLVGIVAAKTLSQQLQCPLIGVNHLHGHIFAALDAHQLHFPLIACIASGGHTMVVHMTDPLTVHMVANTMDDACGEAFDKVARMLGLSYPGGPAIEVLAQSGTVCVPLPHPVQNDPQRFSFSGLKTAVLHSIHKETYAKPDIAASFQHQVATILAHKLRETVNRYQPNQVVLCGGVFANRVIRSHIVETIDAPICIPAIPLCTDNAGMIGLAARVYRDAGVQSTPVTVLPGLGLAVPCCER